MSAAPHSGGEIGRVTKKVRRENESSDEGAKGAMLIVGWRTTTMGIDPASFKDLLLGESRSHSDAQEDDDFVLLKGDATRERVDEIPSTNFPGRIHALIVKRVDRTILSSY
ncbi:hypothetical protein J1N35_040192 [Gossypium stocksii]|uniref:Uncharacterized protein n=1 Tax=Gossypium stocksii TaxID=47602 RepID=A0A9D3UD34_9ROSI|nr:hypothetical protein J1N35_040192 [Gossypium stocksii]